MFLSQKEKDAEERFLVSGFGIFVYAERSQIN